MVSGGIGIASPGQLSPGAIAYASPAGILLPAPFERTFFVPQNGLPWDGEKTPETSLNFSFDWGIIGTDTIATSAWELESSDIANQLSAIDPTDKISSILISGGVAKNIYNVTNVITTQSGLRLDATFRLLVNSYNW